MLVPIELASKGSTKFALRPIAQQFAIQGLSYAPGSNLIFFATTIS